MSISESLPVSEVVDERGFAARQCPTVAVIGLGYVGLPTALALYKGGVSVIGIDISPARIDQVLAGSPDLLDADLRQLAVSRRDLARFRVGSNFSLLAEADCILICVPTPIDGRQTPNLAPLRSACAAVVAKARTGQTFVLTSTTYVGCTRDLLVEPLAERSLIVGRDVHVCFAPERIDPANSKFEITDVPKVVGGVTPLCVEAALPVLGTIAGRIHVVSSPEAAEMTKLLENTFRAVNITLANEVADITRGLGLNPIEVIDAASTKPYGFMPFYPGPGVGGHCIPCDPHYLLWQLRDARMYPPVISAAMQGIATRPGRVVQRAAEVLELAERPLRGSRVLVVGVSYKPNVADARESPALEVIHGLQARGARVSVYDPLLGAITVGETTLLSIPDLSEIDKYDLVIATCRHDIVDAARLLDAALLLDATYTLADSPNRFVP